MTLQRHTAWAKRIGAGTDSSVRQELAKSGIADRANYPISAVEQSQDLKAKSADELEVFPGHLPDNKTDQFLHFGRKDSSGGSRPKRREKIGVVKTFR
jgi:hypothetical protein